MIKYRTTRPLNIEKIEVQSETNCFVIFPSGHKAAKRSDYLNYFDTFDEAKNHVVGLAESKVKSLRLALEQANGTLGRVKGIKES